MHLSVTFKNLDPSDALKSYAQKKLDRIDKLLDTPADATIVFSVEKIRHIAEVSLTGDRLKLHAREESDNMYSSIDMVIDKLKKQLNRSRDKERVFINNTAWKQAEAPEPAVDFEGEPPQVVIENIEYKPMDVDEAILQMKLTDQLFFVFTNAGTERVNVLYRRGDGLLGLIKPNT